MADLTITLSSFKGSVVQINFKISLQHWLIDSRFVISVYSYNVTFYNYNTYLDNKSVFNKILK